jgi:3,4-dihydroxy 2-butanone 4-phosphate synthase / GTP cyclohydrolase II
VMSSIATAIEAISRGDVVLVVDDEGRENEGDMIMAAEAASSDRIAFFLQHTSGVICAALHGQRLDELNMPLMVSDAQDAHGTAFTVSVDAARGTTTGISAHDRAQTVQALADPTTSAADFVRPGHIFPLRSRAGGVLKRAGHTEAALDLAELASVRPAGVLCEVVSADKSTMAGGLELRQLSQRYRLPFISIAELIRHRLRRERLVESVSSGRVPTRYGTFTCHAFRSRLDGIDHVALVRGSVDDGEPVLVRVHSECLTGDVFASERCDCGTQLDDALRLIAQAGRGVVVYLRGHEGRGIGIAHKLRAYDLQDRGRDTVDANLELGLTVDDREYGIGAQILMELGVHRLRLITNNPAKYHGLEGYGHEIVERIAIPPTITPENIAYLRTKRARMGHDLRLMD